ncbi:AzlD domain-containing protein [Labedaea rhizosphaerae]|uniref:Branched-subunit amino acid transport protein AzlD n=1 Tax=Labedaea rhizosphaerae TaxID=598644 RepID=A0A4R6SI40_LABRH|nr:AzlD domain-containing protein [Labedaea rhizosphaerae]TDQ01323.1 branched-subunit amino acid transport protein AzlD [Labedaea rhizosphaerae]
MTFVPILVLALGTYAFRISGTLLRGRMEVPERIRELLSMAAIVLLVAVVATSALMTGHQFAGFALPLGVAVGGVLAWRKAPFVVVVVVAAATTALLRLAGLS